MSTPQPLGASLVRERAAHAAWNRLFELAAIEHSEKALNANDQEEPPEWARCVAALCGYQLLPANWRLTVDRGNDGVNLTLHSPGGYGSERGTFTVAHGVDTQHGNVVADFGRALMGAGVAEDPDPMVQANLAAIAALRKLAILKIADGTYLDNDLQVSIMIRRVSDALERRVLQNEMLRKTGEQ